MKTTKVFKSGNSQAVRIPKEFHIHETELVVQRNGDVITLTPLSRIDRWKALNTVLGNFSDDFMADGREQPNNLEERLSL